MIKTIHICDKCGKEFINPIPPILRHNVTRDVYLKITVTHIHIRCKYDMCNNCKNEALREYVKKLDSEQSYHCL